MSTASEETLKIIDNIQKTAQLVHAGILSISERYYLPRTTIIDNSKQESNNNQPLQIVEMEKIVDKVNQGPHMDEQTTIIDNSKQESNNNQPIQIVEMEKIVDKVNQAIHMDKKTSQTIEKVKKAIRMTEETNQQEILNAINTLLATLQELNAAILSPTTAHEDNPQYYKLAALACIEDINTLALGLKQVPTDDITDDLKNALQTVDTNLTGIHTALDNKAQAIIERSRTASTSGNINDTRAAHQITANRNNRCKTHAQRDTFQQCKTIDEMITFLKTPGNITGKMYSRSWLKYSFFGFRPHQERDLQIALIEEVCAELYQTSMDDWTNKDDDKEYNDFLEVDEKKAMILYGLATFLLQDMKYDKGFNLGSNLKRVLKEIQQQSLQHIRCSRHYGYNYIRTCNKPMRHLYDRSPHKCMIMFQKFILNVPAIGNKTTDYELKYSEETSNKAGHFTLKPSFARFKTLFKHLTKDVENSSTTQFKYNQP